MSNEIEFNIKVRMRTRWVPYFLRMLKHMQYLGGIGSSRQVTFYSDGDGDFRPTFKWDEDLPSDGHQHEFPNGDTFYDAG